MEPFGFAPPGFAVPFNDVGAIEEAIGAETAAVILEPIPATLGFPRPHRAIWRSQTQPASTALC